MKILRQHIGTTIILSTLMILFVLIGLQAFITFIKQLDDIGVGNYNLWRALEYIPLTLPNQTYSFFPMAGLLGSIIGLGYLASNSELIVMRAAGVSIKQITWAVFRAAIILTIIVTLTGEWLGPHAAYSAKNLKALAKTGGQILNTTEGLWMRDGNNFIHIQRLMPGQLNGITQYQFSNDHRLIKTSYAKTAEFHHKTWWLKNNVETDFYTGKTKTKNIGKQSWSVKVNPELSNASYIDPQTMPLNKLYHLIQYQKTNGLETNSTRLSFFQRLIQPFSTLVMILLSIPFIFGPLRTVSMGLRLTVGTITGFSFYLLNKFFGPFVLVYQISPIIGAILPSLLFFCIGWRLINRIR